MVRDPASGSLIVAGVPLGDGFLPVKELTARLLGQGLRRITYENVWAYCAPIKPGREPIGGVRLGDGAFRFAAPPFRPDFLILDQSEFSGEGMVRLERRAFMRGLAAFRDMLNELGVTGYRAIG